MLVGTSEACFVVRPQKCLLVRVGKNFSVPFRCLWRSLALRFFSVLCSSGTSAQCLFGKKFKALEKHSKCWKKNSQCLSAAFGAPWHWDFFSVLCSSGTSAAMLDGTCWKKSKVLEKNSQCISGAFGASWYWEFFSVLCSSIHEEPTSSAKVRSET